MLSSVGLEVNSTSPELNWKTVTKGRRSRKSIARSLNGIAKVGNSTSPKRVGDFSGSDSDKFGDAVLGQSTSGNSENVPIKKRRHLLRSPSPHPWTPSLRRQDSSSPRPHSSSPHSEDHEQLPYPSCSSGQRSLSSYSNWQLRGIYGSAKVRIREGFDNIFLCDRTEGGYNNAGDFSGIELLAAAASMDDDTNNADKEDLVAEDSLMPKNADASSFATQSNLQLKCNESENSSTISMTVHGGNTDCSLVRNNSAGASQTVCGSPEDGTLSKINRQHWDLNTLMDAWGEPYDDTIAGNTSKDVNDDMHMEERQKDSIAAKVTSDKATGNDADERNSNQVLSCDADMDPSNQVMNADAIVQISPLTKVRCSSSMLMSEEKINTMSGTVAIMQDEDWSSNVSECDRTTASDLIQARTQDVTLHDMPAIEMSESGSDVLHTDTKDSQKTSEPPGNTISSKEIINFVACERLDVDNSESNSHEVNCFNRPSISVNFLAAGTFIQDGQSVRIADSKIQNDGIFVTGSTIADNHGHLEQAELVAELECNNLLNEKSKSIIMEDTCKSSSAGAQCDGLTTVGKIGSNIDAQHDSDVSRDNHVHMVDGDDLTGLHEGYDSPYEDGELRGSFLYSWEDNEFGNECVDYESDLRNGDGSDAVDYPGSEIVEEVEGGSEGSHGTERRNLSMKRSPEGQGSKAGSAKHSFKRHFIQDDSDNNGIAGKGESNAGSGTTVEQSMEMDIEENDDGMKRKQLTDRREAVGGKVAQMDEYVSKMARRKLQSRIEGRSSMDATDEKDVFFIQQCRSHRLGGSYTRPERDISPDKYLGRYKPATHHSEREGVDQWTYWGSRKRYSSSYQGAEGRSHTRPRSIIDDSADKFGGFDFHDPRQNANYWSKGLQRPLMRRSPVDRDDCLGMRRRMPLTRGVSSYRNRGHYSQRAGRDFGGNFEPLPDEAATSGRLPRYLSRRERSFSPSSGRSAHIPLQPRRRSRSRSRTRSPRAWPSHRERNLGARRNSRSPDFRSEARMERTRVPFPKPTFASNYGDGYVSPSRGRFSPQRNCRWVDDRSFGDNHLRRRRSPVRVFRRTQRFDDVGSSGRLRSDEYFRPMIRPGKFSFMAKGGREGKFESNYDDRRRDDSGEMHRGMHSNDGPNVRRFRPNAADDFETSSLNNEDDVRGIDSKDVPLTQSDRDDKRAFKI